MEEIRRRTCVVTRLKFPQDKMVRIARVRELDGTWSVKVDTKLDLYGRGCYIIPELNILEEAFKKNSLPRALKLERALSESEKESLRTYFK